MPVPIHSSTDLFKAKDDDSLAPKDNWACKMIAVERLAMEQREVPVSCGPWE